MSQITFILAEAAGTTGASPATGGGNDGLIQMLITFAPIMLIFYLLFIRPENKRRKEKENVLAGVKAKDKVVTIGGLYGTVVEVDGDDVVLLVDPKKDVKLRFRRTAIEVITSDEDKEKKS